MDCLERGVADAPDIKSCEDKGVAVCRGKQRLITRRIWASFLLQVYYVVRRHPGF